MKLSFARLRGCRQDLYPGGATIFPYPGNLNKMSASTMEVNRMHSQYYESISGEEFTCAFTKL